MTQKMAGMQKNKAVADKILNREGSQHYRKETLQLLELKFMHNTQNLSWTACHTNMPELTNTNFPNIYMKISVKPFPFRY